MTTAHDPKEADERLKQRVAHGELESEAAETQRHVLYYWATFGIKSMSTEHIEERRAAFADATGLKLIDYARIPD